MKKNNKIILFGEDVGKIGDVNKGAEGLQMDFGSDNYFSENGSSLPNLAVGRLPSSSEVEIKN